MWSEPAINPHFPTNGAQIDLLASGLHSAALDTALSHYTALCCLIRCTGGPNELVNWPDYGAGVYCNEMECIVL